jgi:acetyl-CoA carboxylase carboxyltransferase component
MNQYSIGEYQAEFQESKEVHINPDDYKWLNQIKDLWSGAHISTLKNLPLDRKTADGLLSFIVTKQHYRYAVIYNDFKVNGGSFGKSNSLKTLDFIKYCREKSLPLIFLTNSIGARLMDGRKVFTPAFSLIPELASFAENNLLITANLGRSLGLGAIIFSMGHYRFSLNKNSPINLTGPEVINMFFGKGHDFNQISNAKIHQKNSSLVHEVFETKSDMLKRIAKTLDFISNDISFHGLEKPKVENLYTQKNKPSERIETLLESLCDDRYEIYPQLDAVIKVYLIQRNGKMAGVFINPPGNPNNIINIKTLEKFQSSLQLFKALKIPIVSFLDTPGASPLNFVESKKEIIICIRDIAEKIIEYPYKKGGFIIGRSYGGATILSLPKIFGGDFQYIVKGSQVGIMHEKIIESLLGKNERLFRQWEETKAEEPDDFKDLLDNKTIDKVISYHEIIEELDHLIF